MDEIKFTGVPQICAVAVRSVSGFMLRAVNGVFTLNGPLDDFTGNTKNAPIGPKIGVFW